MAEKFDIRHPWKGVENYPLFKGKNFFFSFVWLGLLLFVIDIVSKWAVVKALNGVSGASIEVIPHFFYLTLTFNEGMAFGLGDGKIFMRIIYIVISWLATFIIPFFYYRNLPKEDKWINAVFMMCWSGAIGNAIDRTFYWKSTVGFSGVVDFFQFYIFGYNKDSFAIFNFADACLVVGIFLAMILMFIREYKEEKAKKGNA